MSTANRVLKNTLILYAKTGVTMFLSLYTTRVVLRELGADGFGVFVLIGGIIAMFGFLNGSMAAATQRFMSYAHGKGNTEEQRHIFNISFVLHASSGILIAAILAGLGPLLFKHVFQIDESMTVTAKMIYYFVVGSVCFSVVTVPYNAVIIARENMLFLAMTGFIESILKCSIAIWLTYTSGNKLLTYGGLMAFIPIIILLINACYCHYKYTECSFSRFGLKDALLIKMTKFASWSLLGSASSFISSNAQAITLNAFFGTSLNAAQGIANQVGGQLGVLSQGLQSALNPVITKREGSGQRKGMIEATFTGSKLNFFLKVIILLPVLLETPYLLSIWLPETPTYSVIFCRLFLIKIMIESPMPNLHAAISSIGRIKHYQIVSSIIAPLPLIASIVLFKVGYSPPIIYVAFLCHAILLLAAKLYFCSTLFSMNIKEFSNDVILKCSALFTISTTLGYIPLSQMDPSLYRLILVTMATLTSQLFMLILLLNRREKSLLRSTLITLIKKFTLRRTSLS